MSYRKFIPLILTICILLGALPAPAIAQTSDALIKTSLTPIYTVLAIANTISVKAFIYISQLFSKTLQMRVTTDLDVIKVSWRIVRDFCNMLFIVVLILISFGTIFGTTFRFLEGYDVRKLLVGFIFAAVLINFSLPLCQLGASISQSVSNIFLSAIGNSANRIGQFLVPSAFVGAPVQEKSGIVSQWGEGVRILCNMVKESKSGIKYLIPGLESFAEYCVPAVAAETATTVGTAIIEAIQIARTPPEALINKTVGLFFSTLLVIIVGVGLLGATLFAFIRIPIIWLLIVFSPIAVLFNILPITKGFAKQWVREFVSWNTFLPIFLLILTFGMFFLSSQSLIAQGLGVNINEGFVDSIGATPEYILFYIIALLIFIFGTAGALKASRSFGGSAGEVFEKHLQGRISIGAVTSYRPAWYKGGRAAAEERVARVKEKGLPGKLRLVYGGKAAEERWKQRLLGKAPTSFEQMQKGIAEQKSSISTRINRLATRAEREKLLGGLGKSGTVEQQIAARQLRQELFKSLNAQDLLDTYKLMGGNKNIEAEKFASELEFKDMSPEDRRFIYNRIRVDSTLRSDEVMRKIAEVMRDKGEFKSGTTAKRIASLMRAARLYKTDDEKKRFLREAAKKDIVASHSALYRMDLMKDRAGVVLSESSPESIRELENKINALEANRIKELAEEDMKNKVVRTGIAKKFTRDKKAAENTILSLSSPKDKPKQDELRSIQKEAISEQITDLENRIAGLASAVSDADKRRRKKYEDKLGELQDIYSKL